MLYRLIQILSEKKRSRKRKDIHTEALIHAKNNIRGIKIDRFPIEFFRGVSYARNVISHYADVYSCMTERTDRDKAIKNSLICTKALRFLSTTYLNFNESDDIRDKQFAEGIDSIMMQLVEDKEKCLMQLKKYS